MDKENVQLQTNVVQQVPQRESKEEERRRKLQEYLRLKEEKKKANKKATKTNSIQQTRKDLNVQIVKKKKSSNIVKSQDSKPKDTQDTKPEKSREELLAEYKKKKQEKLQKTKIAMIEKLVAVAEKKLKDGDRDGARREFNRIFHTRKEDASKCARYWVSRAKLEQECKDYREVVYLYECAEQNNAIPRSLVETGLRNFITSLIAEAKKDKLDMTVFQNSKFEERIRESLAPHWKPPTLEAPRAKISVEEIPAVERSTLMEETPPAVSSKEEQAEPHATSVEGAASERISEEKMVDDVKQEEIISASSATSSVEKEIAPPKTPSVEKTNVVYKTPLARKSLAPKTPKSLKIKGEPERIAIDQIPEEQRALFIKKEQPKKNDDLVLIPVPATSEQKKRLGNDYVLTPARKPPGQVPQQNISVLLEKTNYTYTPNHKLLTNNFEKLLLDDDDENENVDNEVFFSPCTENNEFNTYLQPDLEIPENSSPARLSEIFNKQCTIDESQKDKEEEKKKESTVVVQDQNAPVVSEEMDSKETPPNKGKTQECIFKNLTQEELVNNYGLHEVYVPLDNKTPIKSRKNRPIRRRRTLATPVTPQRRSRRLENKNKDVDFVPAKDLNVKVVENEYLKDTSITPSVGKVEQRLN